MFIKSGIINENGDKSVAVFSVDITEEDAINSFEYVKNQKCKYEKAVSPFWQDEFQRALSDKFIGKIIEGEGEPHKYPTLLKEINTADQIEEVKPLIVFNKTLRNCGIKNTLIIYNNLSESKKSSLLQTIETVMHEESCELMLGIGGGTVILDSGNNKNDEFLKIKDKSIAIKPELS